MAVNLTSMGKFLALVLRHKPEVIGLKLDAGGWVAIDDLLSAMAKHGKGIERETLEDIVDTDNKGRYEYKYNGDVTKIRACQGHSIKDIDLGLEPTKPPEVLYHGTAVRFVNAIINEGLKPGNRQYVHLSLDHETAVKVGSRHGTPFVLKVLSGEMHQDGHEFFLSHNNVWLTKDVPPEYIQGL